jgi:hypothetical protein
MRLCGHPGVYPGTRNHPSGRLLAESWRLLLLCDQPWQSNQVMCRATEDEQPIDFFQSSQLDLS